MIDWNLIFHVTAGMLLYYILTGIIKGILWVIVEMKENG